MTDAHDVMVLAAHPDDAEICCGGTILRLVRAKRRVAIVDMTQGEMGSRGSLALRREECDAATARLGVAHRRNLKLPDTLVRDEEAHLGPVVQAIRELRPRLLLSHFAKDVHPDHVATGLLAERAFFHAGLKNYRPELGAAFRPAHLIRFLANDHAEPSFCVDISDVEAEKRAAIECYASQVAVDDPSHFAKKLDPLERVHARDRYFGARIGCRAAEPFVFDGPLPIGDLEPLTSL